MKKIVLFMGALALAGCASNRPTTPTVNNSREIASLVETCRLEKHPTDESWRVTVQGKPYSRHWYTMPEATNQKARLEKKGHCP